MTDRLPRLRLAAPGWLMIGCMLLFVGWFTAYSIRLHDAHLTHRADLGQIDLAIWNTAHGRLLQEVKDSSISTRLSDHVEPIFMPVSLIYRLWDDVRALLALQALALGLGALPIFRLAQARLQTSGFGSQWLPLAFGCAYLLAPALQAAAVSEFHAVSLAVPLIAWGLWAAIARRWGWLVVAALLLCAVQEGMALLGALLGAYALARSVSFRRSAPLRVAIDPHGALVGGAIVVVALAWFYMATFVIVPHFAAEAYGVGESPYGARYGPLGDSFGAVLKALLTRPGLVLSIASEPLRLRYMLGLLASAGFLALLAPEILALSLPLGLANLLSSYAFQYSGELHYSAPLVPYLIVASLLGLERLARAAAWLDRRRPRILARPLPEPGLEETAPGDTRGRFPGRALSAGLALLTVSVLAWQGWAGYLPVSREFWRRVPGGWPPVTAHERLLNRFLAQIPPAAAGSTTPDLYPHLSHRELLYQFPTLGDARWVLVDVSGTTDLHPMDVRQSLMQLIAAGWSVADAADGYVLLVPGAGQVALPDAFFSFVRGADAAPTHRVDVVFGSLVRLVGYSVFDDVKWRRTGFAYYWQALAPLPPGSQIVVETLRPDGAVADSSIQRPAAGQVWYPPERWQVGETVVLRSDGWYLPQTWAQSIVVSAPTGLLPPEAKLDGARLPGDGTVLLPAWTRRSGNLAPWQPTSGMAGPTLEFSDGDWGVRGSAWIDRSVVSPGATLGVSGQWQALAPRPAARDYSLFVHLRDGAGVTVANGDGLPTWFKPWLTSRWLGDGVTPHASWDAHTLTVPPQLAPGTYQVALGWYDPAGARLACIDDSGNASGDEYVLGSVTVRSQPAPPADLCCALVPECCASKE